MLNRAIVVVILRAPMPLLAVLHQRFALLFESPHFDTVRFSLPSFLYFSVAARIGVRLILRRESKRLIGELGLHLGHESGQGHDLVRLRKFPLPSAVFDQVGIKLSDCVDCLDAA